MHDDRRPRRLRRLPGARHHAGLRRRHAPRGLHADRHRPWSTPATAATGCTSRPPAATTRSTAAAATTGSSSTRSASPTRPTASARRSRVDGGDRQRHLPRLPVERRHGRRPARPGTPTSRRSTSSTHWSAEPAGTTNVLVVNGSAIGDTFLLRKNLVAGLSDRDLTTGLFHDAELVTYDKASTAASSSTASPATTPSRSTTPRRPSRSTATRATTSSGSASCSPRWSRAVPSRSTHPARRLLPTTRGYLSPGVS